MTHNKIAVDARGFFIEEPRGHIKASICLYKTLLAQCPDILFIFYTYPVNNESIKILSAPNSEIVFLDPKGSSLIDYNFLWLNVYLPLSILSRGIHLFHSTCNRIPLLTNAKIISNIYDVISLTSATSERKGAYKHFKNVLRKSKKIITCSNYSKKQIVSELGEQYKDKIEVIYLGPTIEPSKLTTFEEENVLKKIGIDGDFIFALAHEMHPRKNIENILKAFKDYIQRTNAKTVLVVPGAANIDSIKYYEGLCKELGIVNQVIFPGYITDLELSVLYKHSLFFIYLSLDEGFGIPPLDAMSLGCPVIASNTTATSEVVADGGIVVDPLNIEEIIRQFINLNSSLELREKLKLKGLDNLKRFSWRQTAIEYNKVFFS